MNATHIAIALGCLAFGAPALAQGQGQGQNQGRQKAPPPKDGSAQAQAQGQPGAKQAPGNQRSTGQAPQPAQQLKQLAVLEGNWTCTGKNLTPELGPVGDSKANAKIESILGGHWLRIRHEGVGTAGRWSLADESLMGWDADDKVLVWYGADNAGGWSELHSRGWQGDKLVWDGDTLRADGTDVDTRRTFTRASQTEMRLVIEDENDGAMTRIAEMTCKKSR